MKLFTSFLISFLIFSQVLTNAQTFDAQEIELQEKYFNLRDHFHKVHVFVGSRYNIFELRTGNPSVYPYGTSIPCERHDITTEATNCPGIGQTGNYSLNNNMLFTGDGTIKMGWYLVYLATEYKLLADNGKDTKETLNEIYYLLNAIERLDAESEKDIDKNKPLKLDGFFVRDDCPNNLFTKFRRSNVPEDDYGRTGRTWHGRFDDLNDQTDDCTKWFNRSTNLYNNFCVCQLRENSEYYMPPDWVDDNVDFKMDYYDAFHDTNIKAGSNEMSIDQLTYLILGLNYVNKFVTNLYIKPTPADPGFYLIDKVKTITTRFLKNLSQITTHTETFWWNGYSGAKHKATRSINTRWLIVNQDKQKFVLRGNNASTFAYALSEGSKKITNTDFYTGHTPLFDVTANHNPNIKYLGFFENSKGLWDKAWNDLHIANSSGLLANMGDLFEAELYPLAANGVFDLATGLADPSNILWSLGQNAIPVANEFPLAVYLMSDNSKPMALNLLVCNNTLSTNDMLFAIRPYQARWHYPAMFNNKEGDIIQRGGNYLAYDLINAVFNDKTPGNSHTFYKNLLNGANCKTAGGGINGIFDWQHNRVNSDDWVDFTKDWITGMTNSNIEVFPFGYLIAYNLYRIAFKSQINAPTYGYENTCPCNEDHLLDKLTTKTNITSLYEGNKGLLARRFPTYSKFGMHVPDFLRHDVDILSGGEIRMDQDFGFCTDIYHNPTTLTLKDGGKLTVMNYTDAFGDTWPSSTIIFKGCKLFLENNSIVHVQNGCSLIIEEGAELIFNNGAKIILDGTDSYLEIKGKLTIGDNATFTISPPTNSPTNSTARGYVKINIANDRQCITGGIHSKFILTGTDKDNDKILEITQHNPMVANSVELVQSETGKVEMGLWSTFTIWTKCSLINTLVTGSVPLRATPTHDNEIWRFWNDRHKGFAILGNNFSYVQNCTFQNGYNGLVEFNNTLNAR